jgi:tRNA(fMet)-specific endonuclease VapC
MVIDTNIFIQHLREKNKSGTILSSLVKQKQFFITSITLFELLTGATNESKKEDINKLTKGISVLTLDRDSARIAAEIYLSLKSKNHSIEFRDIFIAAICIKNNLPIKTLNKKHFERIEGLKVI